MKVLRNAEMGKDKLGSRDKLRLIDGIHFKGRLAIVCIWT